MWRAPPLEREREGPVQRRRRLPWRCGRGPPWLDGICAEVEVRGGEVGTVFFFFKATAFCGISIGGGWVEFAAKTKRARRKT